MALVAVDGWRILCARARIAFVTHVPTTCLPHPTLAQHRPSTAPAATDDHLLRNLTRMHSSLGSSDGWAEEALPHGLHHAIGRQVWRNAKDRHLLAMAVDLRDGLAKGTGSK